MTRALPATLTALALTLTAGSATAQAPQYQPTPYELALLEAMLAAETGGQAYDHEDFEYFEDDDDFYYAMPQQEVPTMRRDTLYPPQPQAAPQGVVINGKTLTAKDMTSLQRLGLQVPAGRYWYDKRSGAWGYEGYGAMGVIQAGLRVGGKLRADASRGTSRIFINGHQITMQEAMMLQQAVGHVRPGKYWLDANGNAGRVGGPALVNLYQVSAAAQRRSQGGAKHHRNWYTGTSVVSDGNGFIGVTGKNWSAISD